MKHHNQQFDFETVKSKLEPIVYQSAAIPSLDQQFEKINQPIGDLFYLAKPMNEKITNGSMLKIQKKCVIKNHTFDDINLTCDFPESETLPSNFLSMFTQFMTRSIASYQGYCLEAFTKLVNNYDQFIDYYKDKDCKLFLYKVDQLPEGRIAIRYSVIE